MHDSVQPETVLPDGARAELAFILADSRFKVSGRNRAFLKYIGEAAIEGRSNGIKAYAIAVDVFGRDADFNGDIDPIVRIEATRIRQSLLQYYASFGAGHCVHIRLPRGRYIAEFHPGPVQGTDEAYKLIATYNVPHPSLASNAEPPPARALAIRQMVVTAVIGLLVGASGLAAVQTLFR